MLKEKLRIVFENPQSRAFWVVNDILAGVVIAATVLVLLELDPALSAKYGEIFTLLEFIIVGVFTLEYAIYIYLAKKKWSYILSFYGVIDLLAILPTFLVFSNFQFLKALRITRLMRLFRLLRLLKILRVINMRYQQDVATRQMLKFNLEIYLASFVVLTVVFAVLLFHIEQNVPGSQIITIQDAVWSVVSGLTSVGLGNTFPASFPGKMFLGFVMLTGVGFLSFAILTVGKFFQLILFGKEIEDEQKRFTKQTRKTIEQEMIEQE